MLAACTAKPVDGGPLASGGSSSSGGASGGGSGGKPGTGGATATGGSSASGGTTPTGGALGSGGVTALGGTTSSGGATSTGGIKGTGGSTSTGGATGAGGATSTGGSYGSGGHIGLGGATSTGGVSGTGGATITGGTSGKGGSTGTGGAAGTGGTSGKGGSTGTGGATGAGGSTHAGTWRIMPFGDSITATMCPPQLLDQELKAKGSSNFAFVGTKVANQSCNGAPNTKCEGQGGIWATNLVPGGANPELLSQWATGSQYDVVLMHLGTNDCWSPGAVPNLQSVIDAFSVIIDAFRAANPNVIVFIAQIIPLNPANCTTCEPRVQQLNSMIPAFATSKTTAASPVYVANIHAAFDGLAYTPNSTYSTDGAHPTPAGSQLMADAWYAALAAKGIP